MHTEPFDPHGQDLPAIISELGLTEEQVVLSTQKVSSEELSKIYSSSDCTINISDAEGFGLATLESLACEVPIIVNMTGGMQDQCGLRDDDGNLLTPEDYIELEKTTSKRKSCVVSRSFGKRVENFQELKEAVASYCLNASEKLRSENLVAKALTVFVRTSPFQRNFGYYSNSKTIDFPIATNNSIETVKTAITILESIYRNGYRYQKAGVMFSGLSDENSKENLFASEKDEKINKLMRSIDKTNFRFGRRTLSIASAGIRKKWFMKREHSSKIDTADFYCIPTIKAI